MEEVDEVTAAEIDLLDLCENLDKLNEKLKEANDLVDQLASKGVVINLHHSRELKINWL